MITGTPSTARLPSIAEVLRPIWDRAILCGDALTFSLLVGVPVSFIDRHVGQGDTTTGPLAAIVVLAAVLYVGILWLSRMYRRPAAPSLGLEIKASVIPVAIAVLAASALPLGSAMALHGLLAMLAAIPFLVVARAVLNLWLTRLGAGETLGSLESGTSDPQAPCVNSESPADTTVLSSADAFAMISHDLRTPLTTLRAVGEMALDEELASDDRDSLLQIMARQAIRLDNLAQELLDAFRLEAGKLQLRREAFSMAALCQEVADEVERSSAGARRIIVRIDEVEPIIADRLKLRSVVRNLLSNAVKHTQDGTEVTVSSRRTGGDLLVSVDDDGQGISPEHLPHLFDRFYRAGERSPNGIGLGLYAARALVQAHGGRIWAESNAGGSRFTFSLPMDGVAETPAAYARRARPLQVTVGPVSEPGSRIQSPHVVDPGRGRGIATL
jgi:signal transduction histidine kinase